MSDKITIELPDELGRDARAAAADHRPLEDAVVEWIRRAVTKPEVKTLSDDEVSRLCDATLEPDDQEELSGLLADAREGRLDAPSRARLDDPMSLYRRGLVLKARSWEAGWCSRPGPGKRPWRAASVHPPTTPTMPREYIPAELDRRVHAAAQHRGARRMASAKRRLSSPGGRSGRIRGPGPVNAPVRWGRAG